MSAKVANVIAVELGLLIAILSWLAFSDFSRLKPAALADELRAPENSMAMIRPLPRQPNYPQNPAPHATAPQSQLATGVQPTVQSNQALQYGALDYYDQPVASTPYTVVDDTPAQTAPYYDSYYDPYYSGGYQQPTIPYPDDYYSLPNDYGYYPSPGQIIVVTNTRVARERSRACFNHPPMQAGPPRHAPGGGGQFRPPNRPGGRDFHSPGGVVAPRGGGGGAIAPRGGNGGGSHSGATRGTGGSRASRTSTASMPR